MAKAPTFNHLLHTVPSEPPSPNTAKRRRFIPKPLHMGSHSHTHFSHPRFTLHPSPHTNQTPQIQKFRNSPRETPLFTHSHHTLRIIVAHLPHVPLHTSHLRFALQNPRTCQQIPQRHQRLLTHERSWLLPHR